MTKTFYFHLYFNIYKYIAEYTVQYHVNIMHTQYFDCYDKLTNDLTCQMVCHTFRPPSCTWPYQKFLPRITSSLISVSISPFVLTSLTCPHLCPWTSLTCVLVSFSSLQGSSSHFYYLHALSPDIEYKRLYSVDVSPQRCVWFRWGDALRG